MCPVSDAGLRTLLSDSATSHICVCRKVDVTLLDPVYVVIKVNLQRVSVHVIVLRHGAVHQPLLAARAARIFEHKRGYHFLLQSKAMSGQCHQQFQGSV